MGLDIRVPIGAMFTILGGLLVLYGLLGDDAAYARSLGYNINLAWGAVVLAFGLGMLYYGRRGRSAMRPAEASAEGAAIEPLERQWGPEARDTGGA